jgi:hypothetical protein
VSRFIAHIRHADPGMPDAQIDCDSARVDEQGNLLLNRHIRDGNATTVDTFGCYQAAFWASYRLEAPPDEDRDGRPTEQAPPPEVSTLVHLIAPGRPGCVPSFVYRINPNDTVTLWPVLDAGPYPRETAQDESRQAEFSWHRPCDDEASDPEPSALPQVCDVVHIYDAARSACLPGPVISLNHTALEVETGETATDPRFSRYITIHHDETRTIDHSWHRPCTGDTNCTWKPTPGTALNGRCPDCQHAVLVHFGVDHCPVCELVAHAHR